MGMMNVADFERGAVAVQAPGAERGELSLMREFRDGIGLIHELRKLRGTEKFPDDRGHGADVDESRRRDLHGILRRHSLLDEPLQAGDAYAQLILQELSHRTNAAVAQMVDIVYRADAVFQIEIGGDGSYDVVHGDVLVAQLIRERADLLLFLFGGNGVFAREDGVEGLARLHEFAAVVAALFAVFLLFLLLVRLFGLLLRIVKRVERVDVFFRHFFHGHLRAVRGDHFGKSVIRIINGGQKPEILGARL